MQADSLPSEPPGKPRKRLAFPKACSTDLRPWEPHSCQPAASRIRRKMDKELTGLPPLDSADHGGGRWLPGAGASGRAVRHSSPSQDHTSQGAARPPRVALWPGWGRTASEPGRKRCTLGPVVFGSQVHRSEDGRAERSLPSPAFCPRLTSADQRSLPSREPALLQSSPHWS